MAEIQNRKYNDGLWYAFAEINKLKYQTDLSGMTKEQVDKWESDNLRRLYKEYIATH